MINCFKVQYCIINVIGNYFIDYVSCFFFLVIVNKIKRNIFVQKEVYILIYIVLIIFVGYIFFLEIQLFLVRGGLLLLLGVLDIYLNKINIFLKYSFKW